MPFSLPIPIPVAWQQRYRFLRVGLYVITAGVTVFFALRVLFPTITQSFDFRSPSSSKNAIQNPRSLDNTPRTNGKIEQNGTLVADTTVLGDFSVASVVATLEKSSAFPETLSFILHRSYQSFLAPTGEAVSDFPEETTYLINDTYYALRADMLYPFVSADAYRSRFPETHAILADTAFLARYPISETWLGFRVGSLLSNATGVFIVTSETEVRPVGSAEIFLGLGYNFADVTPVSEEELGVYHRGRIFLLWAPHPDGTVLFDQDTDTYYLIDQGTKRPLLSGDYRDFLLQDKHPIVVSSTAAEKTATCTMAPNIWSTALRCDTVINTLPIGFGNDFEIQIINPETNIDINNLTISFQTAKNTDNMMTLLSQIKQRLLARFIKA